METKTKRIKTEDDSAFKVATGMVLGSLRDSGNLRIVVTQPDDSQVAIELPQAWLNQEGGLAHFIRENCQPVTKTVSQEA